MYPRLPSLGVNQPRLDTCSFIAIIHLSLSFVLYVVFPSRKWRSTHHMQAQGFETEYGKALCLIVTLIELEKTITCIRSVLGTYLPVWSQLLTIIPIGNLHRLD